MGGPHGWEPLQKTEFCDSLVNLCTGNIFFMINLTTTMSLITEKKSLAQLEVFIPPRTNIGPGEGRCTAIREFWTEFCSGRDKKFELDQRFFFCDQTHCRC